MSFSTIASMGDDSLAVNYDMKIQIETWMQGQAEIRAYMQSLDERLGAFEKNLQEKQEKDDHEFIKLELSFLQRMGVINNNLIIVNSNLARLANALTMLGRNQVRLARERATEFHLDHIETNITALRRDIDGGTRIDALTLKRETYDWGLGFDEE